MSERFGDDFRVIETFRYEPAEGMIRGERHLTRLGRTAEVLGIGFDPLRAETLMQAFQAETVRRMRMTLDRAGQIALTDAEMAPAKPLFRVALHEARLDPEDPWLAVKTTKRALYDQARAGLPEGIDELLFLNSRGEICEGTITNLFLDIEGETLTPALSSGLLPGVLREEMIEAGQAREAVLTEVDLRAARRIRLGNSLRGLIEAELVG